LWSHFDALARVPLMVIRGARSDMLASTTLGAMLTRRSEIDIAVVADQGHAPLLDEPKLIRRIGGFVASCDGCARLGLVLVFKAQRHRAPRTAQQAYRAERTSNGHSPNGIYGTSKRTPDHSGLMPANWITFAHFSDSVATKAPKSAALKIIGMVPSSASRDL